MRATGTLLIADEVQCGLGRTGRAFYSAALGLAPDLMALGKALGAGVPVGAALLSERVAEAVAFGDHGSTYGGNLLACRAASVFLDALEGGLIERVAAAGVRLREGLEALAEASAAIGEVRGDGLMWGMDVTADVADRVVATALERGLLINRTAGTVVPAAAAPDDRRRRYRRGARAPASGPGRCRGRGLTVARGPRTVPTGRPTRLR